MRKIVLLILGYQFLTTITCTAENLNPLSGDKRLDQVTFATAHNAHSNTFEGFKGRPHQKWSIEQHLEHGIRGFMLDTWLSKDKILLCHGGCGKETTIKNRGSENYKYRTFTNALETFGQWLGQNRQEIIVIFLENRVENDRLRDEINSVGNFRPLILTAQDWDPGRHDGFWPTVDWMRENNKRVVIFNEDKSKIRRPNKNDPFFFIYDYVVENQWGTTDKKKACKHRKESQELVGKRMRNLYLFDFFGAPDSMVTAHKKAEKANAYDNLQKAIETCALEGVPAGKRPNFIALDFVDARHDDLMRLVNKYNQ